MTGKNLILRIATALQLSVLLHIRFSVPILIFFLRARVKFQRFSVKIELKFVLECFFKHFLSQEVIFLLVTIKVTCSLLFTWMLPSCLVNLQNLTQHSKHSSLLKNKPWKLDQQQLANTYASSVSLSFVLFNFFLKRFLV